MSAHSSAVGRRCTATLLFVTLQGTACQAWHTEDVARRQFSQLTNQRSSVSLPRISP